MGEKNGMTVDPRIGLIIWALVAKKLYLKYQILQLERRFRLRRDILALIANLSIVNNIEKSRMKVNVKNYSRKGKTDEVNSANNNRLVNQMDNLVKKDNHEHTDRKSDRKPIPDLVGSNSAPVAASPVVNKTVKQELFKKTGRSTSEASGLHSNSNNIGDSDSEEVILRKPKLPEVDEDKHELGTAVER